MWLIIGYGNTLRGDDGVGFLLAEQLLSELSSLQVRVLAVHQLTPELTLDLAAKEVERVLFIDARREQQTSFVLSKLDPLAADGSCGHQLSPELLLYMTHSLYQRSLPGWLLTVLAPQMGAGEILSTTTRSAMPSAMILVKNIVEAEADKQHYTSVGRAKSYYNS